MYYENERNSSWNWFVFQFSPFEQNLLWAIKWAMPHQVSKQIIWDVVLIF